MLEYIPERLDDKRFAICKEALSHVGIIEEPYGSNRGPVEQFFPRWMRNRLEVRDQKRGKLSKGPPWCSFFSCTVWDKALGYHPFKANVGSVHALVGRAISADKWMYKPDSSVDMWFGPQPGDAFVMLKRPYDANRRTTGHIGIIIRVSNDGLSFNCVEGNTGHRVRFTKRHSKEVSEFRGIISPLGINAQTSFETGIVENVEDATQLGTR